jgi:hypothetical protein
MLPPTIDSNKTDAEGRHPRCEDEAALSSLGVAVPQAMKSPKAADHHGVLFSLISDIVTKKSCLVKGWRGGLLAKPTTRDV